MIGNLVDEAEGRAIRLVSPIDAAAFQVFAKRRNGAQKFPLLDGEGANGEVNRGAFLQQEECFEQSDGVFSAGQAYGNAVAFANHLKARDGLAYFVEQCFFEIQ